jgi:hypothetical protein
MFFGAAATKRMARFGLGGLVIGLACISAWAQDEYSIRVEPHQVIVPAFVFLQDVRTSLSPVERYCGFSNATAFYNLRLSDPYKPADCDQTVMRDLTAKDFNLSEDEVAQKIQDVTVQSVPIVNVRDSVGWHVDYSYTPLGKWSTSDLGPLLIPGDVGYRDGAGWHPTFYYSPAASGGVRYLPGSAGFFYRIAYKPPQSAEGSCHKVRVGVNGPNASVFARRDYCNVKLAPSDPLEGSKLGDQLLGYATAGQKGTIPLSLQAAVLPTVANLGRVEVALSFPWHRLWRAWREGTLYATIGVLGMVYNQQGALVLRFSDFGCCSQDRPDYVRGRNANADHARDKSLIPARYEAQFDLPPGEYKLRVVLGDGRSFGLADSPFTIEAYDSAALNISSVVLCDRFRDAAVAAQEDAAAVLAPAYAPLVSRGAQFAPAGDTRMKAGQRLFAYFEVQDPLVLDGSTKLNMQMKITKLKNGDDAVDTGPRDIAAFAQPVSAIVHIAEELDVNKLPRGTYRVEVQASDSAGRSSAWHSASFEVE